MKVAGATREGSWETPWAMKEWEGGGAQAGRRDRVEQGTPGTRAPGSGKEPRLRRPRPAEATGGLQARSPSAQTRKLPGPAFTNSPAPPSPWFPVSGAGTGAPPSAVRGPEWARPLPARGRPAPAPPRPRPRAAGRAHVTSPGANKWVS